MKIRDSLYRELREGTLIKKYLAMEKQTTVKRIRATGRAMEGFKQNNKSEFRLLSCVPAREFFRWKKVDPHFWDDDKNLKSLKRDNPEMQIFV